VKRQLLHKHRKLGKEKRVKFVSVKDSYLLIRRTHVPNLGRWIIYTKHKEWLQNLKNYLYKGCKLKTKQCLSMTRLTNRVCAPTWNVLHIVSTLLHFGLQRNDQYTTHNQRPVPLLPWNRQRKEHLDQCPDLMEFRWIWILANPSLLPFWRTKKSIRHKPIGFGFSGLFDFLFLSCPNSISIRRNRYFLNCSTTRIRL